MAGSGESHRARRRASAVPRPDRRRTTSLTKYDTILSSLGAASALNVGTSAKDRKGIFAPHLIIPAAYLARLSFGRAQSRERFALDRVDVLHGFAGAFHQRPRADAQGSKGFAIERAEECVVDCTDLGADAVDLEAAGGRECEQHAAAVLGIGPLEQQSEPRHLAGLRGDEGTRHVHGLGDRADPD